MTIKSKCVPAISHFSMTFNVFLVTKELYSHWPKKVAELAKLALSLTKTQIIAKINLSTQIFKTQTGKVQRNILTFKNKLNKKPRIHCMKNVLFKNHFPLENNVFNAAMTSISIMTRKNVQNVTMASISIKTFILVHLHNQTSKQILKRHQT